MAGQIQAMNLQTQIISGDSSFEMLDDSAKIFRDFGNRIHRHPFVQKLARKSINAETSILQNQNSIKPKMFTKLVKWMSKLSSQTLDFSEETLQIAVEILLAYLCKTSTIPSDLQLLACTCLHMASKINEKTIVAIQSYMECSMNIFSKKDFQLKEIDVYRVLDCQIPTFTMHSAFYFLLEYIVSQRVAAHIQPEIISGLLKQASLELKFLEMDTFTFVCNLVAEVAANPEFDLHSEEFLALLKARTIHY